MARALHLRPHMSKLSAVIATVVLGSGSLASASPGRSFDFADRRHAVRTASVDRDYRNDRAWRDRGDLRDTAPRRYRSTWVALGSPVQLADGCAAIGVSDRGTFTQLRLQTTAGASRVDRVVISFRDGSRQVVEPDRVLDQRTGMFEILLDGNNRQIDRVVVEGASARGRAAGTMRSELQVYGI